MRAEEFEEAVVIAESAGVENLLASVSDHALTRTATAFESSIADALREVTERSRGRTDRGRTEPWHETYTPAQLALARLALSLDAIHALLVAQAAVARELAERYPEEEAGRASSVIAELIELHVGSIDDLDVP